YAPPQYGQPQYAPPQQAQPQYGQPQYAPPVAPPAGQAPYGPTPHAQGQYAQSQQQPTYQQPAYSYQQQQQQYSGTYWTPGPGEPFDGAMHSGELNRPLYGATMAQAFTRFFKNYANFTGRASRSEYWWMALSFALAYIAFVIVSVIFSSIFDDRGYSSY